MGEGERRKINQMGQGENTAGQSFAEGQDMVSVYNAAASMFAEL